MPDDVRLDAQDAANIARYLNELANLIDPESGPPYEGRQLTDVQRRLLTQGRVIGNNPGQLAELFRTYVANIYGELGEEAPEL